MSSSVPYLLRGIHEWILDNGCTPYLILDASVEGTAVPKEYIEEGQIVLNISPTAIRNLDINDEFLSFSGRFQGTAREIYAPIDAVLGIVARENGEGMWFPKDDDPGAPDPPPPPTLRVIK